MAEKKDKKKKKNSRSMMSILGGSFLVREKFVRQLPFVLLVTALLMILITNTYIAENCTREIAKTSKELNDLHVEYIQLKSDIMQASKQSVLAKRLKNSGIKEPIEPLKRINADEEPNNTEKP